MKKHNGMEALRGLLDVKTRPAMPVDYVLQEIADHSMRNLYVVSIAFVAVFTYGFIGLNFWFMVAACTLVTILLYLCQSNIKGYAKTFHVEEFYRHSCQVLDQLKLHQSRLRGENLDTLIGDCEYLEACISCVCKTEDFSWVQTRIKNRIQEIRFAENGGYQGNG